jgi:hypothetical protein
MDEDTAAMNTARQSAVRTKAKPSGKGNVTVMVRPDRTTGIRDAAATKDEETAASAMPLRSLVEIYPASGVIAAATRGTNTQDISMISLVIFTQNKKKPLVDSGLLVPNPPILTEDMLS